MSGFVNIALVFDTGDGGERDASDERGETIFQDIPCPLDFAGDFAVEDTGNFVDIINKHPAVGASADSGPDQQRSVLASGARVSGDVDPEFDMTRFVRSESAGGSVGVESDPIQQFRIRGFGGKIDRIFITRHRVRSESDAVGKITAGTSWVGDHNLTGQGRAGGEIYFLTHW